MRGGFPMDRIAIVRAADPFELLRCRCPECMQLDLRYPTQGYQLRLPMRGGQTAREARR